MKRVLPVLALVVILLSAPIGLMVKKANGREPYPALFMPGFGLVPGPDHIDNFDVFTLTGITENGTSTDVDLSKLLPTWGPHPQILGRQLFGREDRMRSAEACLWLTRRLASVHPDRTYVAAEARWVHNSQIPAGSKTAAGPREPYRIDLRACR